MLKYVLTYVCIHVCMYHCTYVCMCGHLYGCVVRPLELSLCYNNVSEQSVNVETMTERQATLYMDDKNHSFRVATFDRM